LLFDEPVEFAGALTSLIPALSCRSCQPNAPVAELVRLSDKSVTDELHTHAPLMMVYGMAELRPTPPPALA